MNTLTYVKFYDHSQNRDHVDGVQPEDLVNNDIPINITEMCGWVLKEDDQAIWLFRERVMFPENISVRPTSEGFQSYWCILKNCILERKEFTIGDKV